ncbi:MAG TPA: tetratricopeptide repeat protein [Steroidobacteraceae bacterium]
MHEHDPAQDRAPSDPTAISPAFAELESLEPGTVIGRYRVLKLLGRGGMGAVYLAERADEQFEQQVALKLIGRTLPSGALARRFRAERQILAHLNHPNIARLLDGGAGEGGVPYLAMEYVEGTRIDRYCEQQQLDVRARLRLFQQVCAAVQYAHQKLVVHRDIKPSNILVTAQGVPKLLDFGIAKLIDPDQTGEMDGLTRLYERVLTPDHASPEQVRGEPISTASDVYSLGVLLYQLLTGTKPYIVPSRNIEALEHVICNLQPPKPSVSVRSRGDSEAGSRALSRVLAGDLDNIVLKAMHKEPERRYPSAGALSEDIGRYLEDLPVQARPDAWTYRAGKFIRRNAGALATAAAVTVTIVGLTTFYTARLAAERDAAQRERRTAAEVSQFMQEVFRVANPSESRGNTVTVREVLDAAVARIDTELKAEPRVRATLLRTMGQVYNGLGLWKQAYELLTRAVAQERASFGNDHIELAQALASLGGVHENLGQVELALSHYDEAWKIREKLGRTEDAEAVGLLTSIAGALRAQQRFEEALDYHSRAERLARALDPPQPHVLGQVLQGYAMTYLLTGELVLAEHLARESLDLVRNAVYEGHDLYANSVYALAESLRRQYKLSEAGELQRELLDLQIRRLGPDALLVARTWNNFSHVMRASGRYDEAREALLQAREIFRKRLGEQSFDLAIAYHNLGGLENEAGRPRRALTELNEALELKVTLAGERSPHLMSTLIEMSAAYRELGELGQAEQLLARAQSIAAENVDATEARRAQLLLEEAQIAFVRGRLEQAEQAARSALSLLDAQNPGRLATAQCVLANILLARGANDEARTFFEGALETRRRIMPADHWMIAEAESGLGAALSSLDPMRAEELLSQSVLRLRRARPEGDSALALAEKRLASYRERIFANKTE